MSLLKLLHEVGTGLILFIVSLPLVLGISLASGVHLYAGLISALVGGTIVVLISRSHYVVYGPSSALTVTVLVIVEKLETYEFLLITIVIAGLLQAVLAYIVYDDMGRLLFPDSVIKGMTTAIGFVVILKQIPHALGYTYFETGYQLNYTCVAMMTTLIAYLFIKKEFRERNFASLLGLFTLIGILISFLVDVFLPDFAIPVEGRVITRATFEFPPTIFGVTLLDIPWSEILSSAMTVFLVSTMNTMLMVRAVDLINPVRVNTKLKGELRAQGIGNIFCGVFGGLPIAAAVIRSSTLVFSKAATKFPIILTGILLATTIYLIPEPFYFVPFAALSIPLLIIGHRLVDQPFLTELLKFQNKRLSTVCFVSVIAVIGLDILQGIAIGISINVFFYYYENKAYQKEDVRNDPLVVGKQYKLPDLIEKKFQTLLPWIKDNFFTKAMLGRVFIAGLSWASTSACYRWNPGLDEDLLNTLSIFGFFFALFSYFFPVDKSDKKI